MGGIGYITAYLADIARNNILINAHMLEAGRVNGVKRYLYSSSACVYAQSKQKNADVAPLKEEDAFPAEPEPGYGWEKLYAEELCRYYHHDYGFQTRIVRFHNVYGPLGTYDGGKEKAPAAISRKVALLNDGDEIEIWGDGKQTRSFMYIDDCVEGLIRLMASDYSDALNLGTDELVTVDGLGRHHFRDSRQGSRQAARSLQAAGRPRAQQRQYPPAQSPRLGTVDQFAAGSSRYLPLDRSGAACVWSCAAAQGEACRSRRLAANSRMF